MVQEWWTDNMIGEEFPVSSGNITIGFWSTKGELKDDVDEGPVNKALRNPYLKTD